METTNHFKVLKNSEVESVLDYGSLISGLEEGMGLFSKGEVDQPERRWLSIPKHNGLFGSMPVSCNYNDVIATKLITYYPDNKDVPTHQSFVVVFDGKNGSLKGILDGDALSAKRTAAASALATKRLVNGVPEVLAIIGSGVQAQSHYDALIQLYKFKQVRIWSRTKSNAEKLVNSLKGNTIVCDTVEEAVKNADIIVTVTLSSTPVLFSDWVKKGAHINAVGACRPDQCELDEKLVKSSTVYVDSRTSALNESGDIILYKASIYAEIGEVINGTKEAKSTETTIYKSLGIGLQDAVAAKIVLDHLEMLKS